VIAAAIFLDIGTALRAGFGDFLDGFQRLLLFGDLDLVAAGGAVPRTHTVHAHVLLAIRAGDLLATAGFALAGKTLAALDREVLGAFWV
jgi:hypothetical protein